MTTVPWMSNDLGRPAPEAAYDHHWLMQRLGHDEELLLQLHQILVVETAKKLGELVTAIVTGDRLAVIGVAHCLRGMIGTFAAERATAVATEIERAARRQRLDEAGELLERLAQELQTLHSELRLATENIERGLTQ